MRLLVGLKYKIMGSFKHYDICQIKLGEGEYRKTFFLKMDKFLGKSHDEIMSEKKNLHIKLFLGILDKKTKMEYFHNRIIIESKKHGHKIIGSGSFENSKMKNGSCYTMLNDWNDKKIFVLPCINGVPEHVTHVIPTEQFFKL